MTRHAEFEFAAISDVSCLSTYGKYGRHAPDHPRCFSQAQSKTRYTPRDFTWRTAGAVLEYSANPRNIRNHTKPCCDKDVKIIVKGRSLLASEAPRILAPIGHSPSPPTGYA